jgi:hypothetical protein
MVIILRFFIEIFVKINDDIIYTFLMNNYLLFSNSYLVAYFCIRHEDTKTQNIKKQNLEPSCLRGKVKLSWQYKNKKYEKSTIIALIRCLAVKLQ